jgi:hypothetical protein
MPVTQRPEYSRPPVPLSLLLWGLPAILVLGPRSAEAQSPDALPRQGIPISQQGNLSETGGSPLLISHQATRAWSESMTRFSSAILVACLSLAVLGCEDGAVMPHSGAPSTSIPEPQVQTDPMPDPASVLAGRANAAGPVRTNNAHRHASGFTTRCSAWPRRRTGTSWLLTPAPALRPVAAPPTFPSRASAT